METVRLAALAMGTRFEAVLVGEDAGFLRAAGEEALELISDEHVRLSRFEPDSVVSHVNRNASSDWVGVDGEFAELLKLCAQAVTASGGAFDPTVTSSSDCGWAGVELDGRRIRFHEPGLSLDFGAIAKGWALDLARVALLDAGVERALLHGGTSSVLAIGAPPERAGWGVALGEKGAPQCSLRDSALGVSAPNGEAGGEGHVLDPGSGVAANRVAIAAVVSESAAWADAWSTALVVRGEDLPLRNGVKTAFLPRGEALDCADAWRLNDAGSFQFP
jgi:thiamine biosynthesis lipoprotein